MTGIEMAYHVKKARSDLRFVLMSAMPIRKDEWRDIVPMSENIDDFIPKPFSKKQLVQLVKKWEKETQTDFEVLSNFLFEDVTSPTRRALGYRLSGLNELSILADSEIELKELFQECGAIYQLFWRSLGHKSCSKGHGIKELAPLGEG